MDPSFDRYVGIVYSGAHQNILKRVLIHVGAFNLSLMSRAE